MKKIRIKQNKKNIFFVILGRLATYILIYGLLVNISLKILLYIVNNCITTL